MVRLNGNSKDRAAWLAVLARASAGELEALWRKHCSEIGYDILRKPEVGLVMVRGPAGGTGQAFNLGEMTVTRCAVRLRGQSIVGFGYVAGRSPRLAELVAAHDAALQANRGHLHNAIIEPLTRRQLEARHALADKVAGTRVEFFTMVRGG